jgi:hypothetical protein
MNSAREGGGLKNFVSSLETAMERFWFTCQERLQPRVFDLRASEGTKASWRVVYSNSR